MTGGFSVKGRRVGGDAPCFIIAEISGNHHQKYEEAAELVRAAKAAGADAVKLQTYTADTITLNSDKEYFRVSGKDQPDTWKGETLYNLYKVAYTPWEWQPKLKKLADELGIFFFSSPFDDTAVDFLEDQVGVSFYKVASYEAVHIPLLRKIASKQKPVVLSIGFATEEEVALAIETLKESGAPEVLVLHCVTAYSDVPDLAHMNLSTIDNIRTRFGVEAGFSDNNAGIVAPIIAAVVHKAAAVEKHLILSRGEGGPDARFSLEPGELRDMIVRIREGEKNGIESALQGVGTDVDIALAVGKVCYGPASPQEAENRVFRPSIWVKKEVKKGDTFTLENIRVARPGHGLAPKYFDKVLGLSAAQDIEFATPLSLELIEGKGV
jgi:pseudaminic acid synthase